MLPSDPAKRKALPMCRGVLDYFPDAMAYVAHVSKVGNDQHNPGQPMHWAPEKSTDHADCIVRHLRDRGKLDKDAVQHTGKIAWRALALLQTEIEEAGGLDVYMDIQQVECIRNVSEAPLRSGHTEKLPRRRRRKPKVG